MISFPVGSSWQSAPFATNITFSTSSMFRFYSTQFAKCRMLIAIKEPDGRYIIRAKLQTSNDRTLIMRRCRHAWNPSQGPSHNVAYNTIAIFVIRQQPHELRIVIDSAGDVHDEYTVDFVGSRVPQLNQYEIPPELTGERPVDRPYGAELSATHSGSVNAAWLKRTNRRVTQEWAEQGEQDPILDPIRREDYRKHCRRARRIAKYPNVSHKWADSDSDRSSSFSSGTSQEKREAEEMERRIEQPERPPSSQVSSEGKLDSNSDYEYSDIPKAYAKLRQAYVERCRSINDSQSTTSNETRTTMYMVPCPFCEAMRPTQDLMVDHVCDHLLADDNEEMPGNTCYICKQTLSSDIKLRMHVERHRAKALLDELEKSIAEEKQKEKRVERMTCNYCEQEFTEKREFQAHMNGHVVTSCENPEPKWECKRCKQQLPSASALRTHIYQHMMDSILRREAERHHDEMERVSSSSESTLRRTTKRRATAINREEDKPVKCRMCETMCDNQQALSDHMDLHFQFPRPKKPGFQCPTCKRTHDTERKQSMCKFNHKWRQAMEKCFDEPCWQDEVLAINTNEEEPDPTITWERGFEKGSAPPVAEDITEPRRRERRSIMFKAYGTPPAFRTSPSKNEGVERASGSNAKASEPQSFTVATSSPIEQKPKGVRCRLCSEKCSNQEVLGIHMMGHLMLPAKGIKGYQCRLCQRSCEAIEDYQRHVINHVWEKAHTHLFDGLLDEQPTDQTDPLNEEYQGEYMPGELTAIRALMASKPAPTTEIRTRAATFSGDKPSAQSKSGKLNETKRDGKEGNVSQRAESHYEFDAGKTRPDELSEAELKVKLSEIGKNEEKIALTFDLFIQEKSKLTIAIGEHYDRRVIQNLNRFLQSLARQKPDKIEVDDGGESKEDETKE